jgi:hypothetical protein
MGGDVSVGADKSVHEAAVTAVLAQMDITACLRTEEVIDDVVMAAPEMVRCFSNHGSMT